MKKLLSFLVLMLASVAARAQYGPVGFVNCNDAIDGITGGGPHATVVRVTTKEQLSRYASTDAPYIIIVEGKITGQGLNRTKDFVSVGSNKTIVGTKGAELAGLGLDIKGKHNIIIRNLIIHHADPDGIAARSSHHIWVDHCEIYSEDEPVKEDWDGLVDLTVGSSYLTVSYCYFHDHHKACLLNSGTMHFEDNGKNRATYHHNAFCRIDQRCPRIGYGMGHVFCNYYEDIGSYAIGVHTQANVVSANNFFGNGVNHPFENMYATSLDEASCGFVTDLGSHFSTPLAQEFKYQPTGRGFDPAAWYEWEFCKEPATQVAALLPQQQETALYSQVGQVEGLEREPVLWPGNGATDIKADAKPCFSPIEGMTHAEVFFGTAPDNMKKTSLEKIKLQPSTAYFWRVKAYSKKGNGESPLYRFTTAAAKAAKPFPADREHNAKLRVANRPQTMTDPTDLSWRPAFRAVAYNVYLATTPGGIDKGFQGKTVGTSLNTGTLLYGTTYFWRVDAVMADGSIVRGDVWTFSAPAHEIGVGRTETEHLALSGGAFLEHEDGTRFTASNDTATVGEAGPGAMTGVWAGPDGDYRVSVDFLDERVGQARMQLSVNDQPVDSWQGERSNQRVTH